MRNKILCRVAVATALLGMPTVADATPPDPLSARLAVATFVGNAGVSPARPGIPAKTWGYSTSCTITLVHSTDPAPRTVACQFEFEVKPAALSASCSGVWRHDSTMSYTDPVSAQTVVITYDTVTTISEGQGSGTGYNALHLTKVHFVIATLCSSQGSLTGSVSGLL